MTLSNVALVAALPLTVMTASPGGGDLDPPTEIGLPGAQFLALSPDGRLLAAATEPSEPRSIIRPQLCVHDVATLDEHVCADLERQPIPLLDDSLVWSPDSSRLAFTESWVRRPGTATSG